MTKQQTSWSKINVGRCVAFLTAAKHAACCPRKEIYRWWNFDSISWSLQHKAVYAQQAKKQVGHKGLGSGWSLESVTTSTFTNADTRECMVTKTGTSWVSVLMWYCNCVRASQTVMTTWLLQTISSLARNLFQNWQRKGYLLLVRSARTDFSLVSWWMKNRWRKGAAARMIFRWHHAVISR